MRATRFFLFIFILFIGCAYNNSNQRAQRPDKYLIMAQRPTPATYPQSILDNMAHIESMPFDGMFVNAPVCWRVMNGEQVSYDTISKELGILKGAFKKFKHNFLYIFTDYPGDFWDDNAWAITTQNFANMARMARELEFVGIVYDNEEYLDGRWFNYKEDYENPAYNLKEHAEQVMLRGKQIMQAMTAEFPALKVITYHGPYLSEPNYRTPSIIMGQAASWDHYELLGPFFVGMMQGRGEHATVIDGGEVYQYRTLKDFRYSYQIRKYEIASEETNSWFIPYDMRATWPGNINISFGVYNRQWKEEYPMDVEIMRSTLTHALNTCDTYVWYYTESDSWVIPGWMPQEWIDMVRDVRKNALQTQ